MCRPLRQLCACPAVEMVECDVAAHPEKYAMSHELNTKFKEWGGFQLESQIIIAN